MADAMRRLIALLRQLPGIGEKTATRLVFAILSSSDEYGRALADAVAVSEMQLIGKTQHPTYKKRLTFHILSFSAAKFGQKQSKNARQ